MSPRSAICYYEEIFPYRPLAIPTPCSFRIYLYKERTREALGGPAGGRNTALEDFEDIKKGLHGQEEEEGEVSILRLRGGTL